MGLGFFFDEYYVRPIVEGTGYNLVNTVTYALILIFLVYVVLKALNYLDIGLDRRLWINLVPFVILGGVLRALMDIGFFSSLGSWAYVFVTPLIYFLVFLLVFVPLVLVNVLGWSRKWLGYYGVVLLIAFSLAVVFNVSRVFDFTLVLAVAFVAFVLTWWLLKRIGLESFNRVSGWSPVFAHSLDASSTVIAIAVVGGYVEQHVFPSLLFEYFSPWIFIPIKLALVSAAIYYIDEGVQGGWNWILKFMILVLGLGPGVRNMLVLLMGV